MNLFFKIANQIKVRDEEKRNRKIPNYYQLRSNKRNH